MMKVRKWIVMLLGAALAMLLVAGVALASSTTVVVTSNDLEASKVAAQSNGKWFFYNDENDQVDNSLGSFVTGPGSPPSGVGSVQISVAGSQRRNLATYRFGGTPLAAITTLAYSTYNPSAGNGGSANNAGYLQFNVDFNGSDTWQRRLIFVPKLNGTVMQDGWQEWDAINGGNALWSWSGGNTWPDGVVASTRTWNDIKAAFPNVRIRVSDSFLGIRVGEPYPTGYTENIDAFRFGTADGTTTFNFEPLIGPPTDAEQCKNDGWMSFNNPAFKNQGDCIQYVKTDK